ncbi:hypothetical protein M8494_25235 [Serratia ureilytica]
MVVVGGTLIVRAVAAHSNLKALHRKKALFLSLLLGSISAGWPCCSTRASSRYPRQPPAPGAGQRAGDFCFVEGDGFVL